MGKADGLAEKVRRLSPDGRLIREAMPLRNAGAQVRRGWVPAKRNRDRWKQPDRITRCFSTVPKLCPEGIYSNQVAPPRPNLLLNPKCRSTGGPQRCQREPYAVRRAEIVYAKIRHPCPQPRAAWSQIEQKKPENRPYPCSVHVLAVTHSARGFTAISRRSTRRKSHPFGRGA